MEDLTVKFPNGQEVGFEVHPERAKQLYMAGIITRIRPGRYEINPLIEDHLKMILPVVFALLDLNGEQL